MDNTVSTIKGDNYNIKNDNNIEYSVFYEEEGYISLENSTESIEKEKVESGKIKSYRKDHASWGGEVGWVETYAKYAYIDSQGNLHAAREEGAGSGNVSLSTGFYYI